MEPTCDRHRCRQPAGAELSLDRRARVVWIGDLLPTSMPGMRLCTACADRLVVPLGWERHDVRDPSTPLFGTVGRDRAGDGPRRRGPRREAAGDGAGATAPAQPAPAAIA